MIINNSGSNGSSSGLESRVNALEAKTDSMQTQINKNTTDIQNNLSSDILKATESMNDDLRFSATSLNVNLSKYSSSQGYKKVILKVPQLIFDFTVPATEYNITLNDSVSIQVVRTGTYMYYSFGSSRISGAPGGLTIDSKLIVSWSGSYLTFSNLNYDSSLNDHIFFFAFTVEYY